MSRIRFFIQLAKPLNVVLKDGERKMLQKIDLQEHKAVTNYALIFTATFAAIKAPNPKLSYITTA